MYTKIGLFIQESCFFVSTNRSGRVLFTRTYVDGKRLFARSGWSG